MPCSSTRGTQQHHAATMVVREKKEEERTHVIRVTLLVCSYYLDIEPSDLLPMHSLSSSLRASTLITLISLSHMSREREGDVELLGISPDLQMQHVVDVSVSDLCNGAYRAGGRL